MTEEPTELEPSPPPADPSTAVPRPAVILFAAVFIGAMLYNLVRDGSAMLTIFLGSAGMATLGIDVGKITGRR